MFKKTSIFFLLILSVLLNSCKRDPPLPSKFTQKLVIVLIDGPRYEETWGDSTHQYQPYLHDSLQKEGCIFTNFYNNGVTFTVPGHTALLTGHYQNISNFGTEFPMYPSLGQLFLERNKKTADYSWLITSKDKLEVLKTCTQAEWKDKYTPDTDCGPNGLGTGYRDDSTTFVHAVNVLQQQHPDFLFIQFKEPDASGHANNWPAYLAGIKQGDKYTWQIWNLLQSLYYYKGNTVFAITNDHGRHTNGVADGFVSHGDGCLGCRHINLFMAGPGIKKNQIISVPYEQIDLHRTMCSKFGLNAQFSDGKIISEAFN